MSIQNSINRTLGVGAVITDAAVKEAKEDIKIAQGEFHLANTAAEDKYKQLSEVAREAEKIGITGEGELSKRAMSAETEIGYHEKFGKQGLIGAKKLRDKYLKETVNAEKDFNQYQSKTQEIQKQIDKANAEAEAKREAKKKQQEALTVRFGDNSSFQLSPELMARAQIKENK